MGKEFKIIKETATVSATILELVAVDHRICIEIGSQDFRTEYDSLLGDVLNTYRVFLDLLKPLAFSTDEVIFADQLPELACQYEANYQQTLSIARANAEFTYEKYLQFRKRKELKTQYPPLKNSFSRLHDLIDKWIDNDIWLAMSMDTVLKMLVLILADIKDLYGRDLEEAHNQFTSSIAPLTSYLTVIETAILQYDSRR